MKSRYIICLVLVALFGWCTVKYGQSIASTYESSVKWVKENPQLTVVERTGKFVVRKDVYPAYTELVSPDLFEGLVPSDAELRVEALDHYRLSYPVSDKNAIAAWFTRKSKPAVPDLVVLDLKEYRLSADKIETIYTTRIARWWVPWLALTIFVAGAVLTFPRQ
jgi:hypothetical protein